MRSAVSRRGSDRAVCFAGAAGNNGGFWGHSRPLYLRVLDKTYTQE